MYGIVPNCGSDIQFTYPSFLSRFEFYCHGSFHCLSKCIIFVVYSCNQRFFYLQFWHFAFIQFSWWVRTSAAQTCCRSQLSNRDSFHSSIVDHLPSTRICTLMKGICLVIRTYSAVSLYSCCRGKETAEGGGCYRCKQPGAIFLSRVFCFFRL